MPLPVLGNILRSAYSSTPDIELGGRRVRLVARTWVLGLPWGALAWTRPRALFVAGDGREVRLAIRDVTRIIQAALALATLMCVIGALIVNGNRKQARKETSP